MGFQLAITADYCFSARLERARLKPCVLHVSMNNCKGTLADSEDLEEMPHKEIHENDELLCGFN